MYFFSELPATGMDTRRLGRLTIHYWSLAVEEHFYLLWPGMLAFAGRVRARCLTAVLAIAVAVWRWWDFHHQLVNRFLPGLLFRLSHRRPVRRFASGMSRSARAGATTVARAHGWSGGSARAYCGHLRSGTFRQVVLRKHTYSIWESIFLAALVAGTVLHPAGFQQVLENPAMK